MKKYEIRKWGNEIRSDNFEFETAHFLINEYGRRIAKSSECSSWYDSFELAKEAKIYALNNKKIQLQSELIKLNNQLALAMSLKEENESI